MMMDCDFFIIPWYQLFIQGCGFAFIANYREDGILFHLRILKPAFQKCMNLGQICQNSVRTTTFKKTLKVRNGI